MVYGFAAIAVLILLVACFNFTNLATARAMVRAREISLRKVLGARRGQLVVQFLGESVLIAADLARCWRCRLPSCCCPPSTVWWESPSRSTISPIGRSSCALIGIAILTGLLAGAYPALDPVRLPPGLGAAQQCRRDGRAPAWCAPPWWWCSSRSRSGWASPPWWCSRKSPLPQSVDLGLEQGWNRGGRRRARVTPAASQSMVRAMAADPALKGAACRATCLSRVEQQQHGDPGTGRVRQQRDPALWASAPISIPSMASSF